MDLAVSDAVDLGVGLPTLTDDELLAVVLGGDGTEQVLTPRLLPSVDVQNPEAVASAALRGQRSLAVRGLVDAGGTLAPGLLALAATLRSVRPAVALYLGDDDLVMRTFVGSVFWRRDADRWTRHMISAVGAHAFAVCDPQDIGPDVADLQLRVAHRPPAGEGDPLWLCVAASTDDRSEIVAVAPGQAAVAEYDAGGALVRRDALPVAEVVPAVIRCVEVALSPA